MWGSYYGMAGSFDEAWTNYNGGFLTSGMAAAYFSMLWGAQVSGLGAGYADGGYNLSYTATSTGNSYGGLFFSMGYIAVAQGAAGMVSFRERGLRFQRS
jgi:hypothetical protein